MPSDCELDDLVLAEDLRDIFSLNPRIAAHIGCPQRGAGRPPLGDPLCAGRNRSQYAPRGHRGLDVRGVFAERRTGDPCISHNKGLWEGEGVIAAGDRCHRTGTEGGVV
jgi:hypothetical protein